MGGISIEKIQKLDYIRIFAISIILIYHFYPHILPAGFLGVNIFFVLSGFLVNQNIITEIQKNNSFNLIKYYKRKFKKIFPSLLLMISISLVLLNFTSKDYIVDIDRQVSATFSFMTNWYEIIRKGSYEAQFIRHIFIHTWFLAVQVHFYIIYPIIIILIHKNSKKENFLKILLKFAIICMIMSYSFMIISNIKLNLDIQFIYFSDMTRLSSFFMGIVLSLIIKNTQQLKYEKTLQFLIYIAVFILSLIFSYNNKSVYTYVFILVDILTCILIYIYLSGENKKVNENIQKLSGYIYFVYLFHYPILVITQSIIQNHFISMSVIIIATILLAIFNKKIWERIYNCDMILFKNKQIKDVLVLVLVAFVFISTRAYASNAPKITSLEEEIFISSLEQDIDKIKEDLDIFYTQDIQNKIKNKRIQVENTTKKQIDVKKDEQSQTNKKTQNTPKQETKDKIQSNPQEKDPLKDAKITVIGDSVLLGPRNYIMDNIKNTFVDAQGYRLLEEGQAVLKQLIKDKKLGNYVVIALGTNAIEDKKKSLENIMSIIPKGTRLILVTPYDARFKNHSAGKIMRELEGLYDYITVMDWEEYAKSNEQLYKKTDGIHFAGRQETYKHYVKLLNETLKTSSQKRAKQ